MDVETVALAAGSAIGVLGALAGVLLQQRLEERRAQSGGIVFRQKAVPNGTRQVGGSPCGAAGGSGGEPPLVMSHRSSWGSPHCHGGVVGCTPNGR